MKKKLSLLMVALMAIAAFAGLRRAEGDKVIYSWPGGDAANKVTLAEGVTVEINGNTSKSVSGGNPITVNETQYTTMKVSNGAQNTLTLSKKAKAVTFYSYVNKNASETTKDSYWKEVAGVDYTVDTSGGKMTCFKDGDLTKPDARRFEFTDPISVITFTNTGDQLCYIVEVEYEGAEEPTYTWETTTSIAVGDIILLTNVEAKKELKAIEVINNNSIGTVVDYTDIPAGVYPLTVVPGSTSGSFAFKNGDNYLSWATGNTLTTSTELNAASSWTVTFNDGVPTINNVGTTVRDLSYNSGSPRFACYGNANQKRVTLWKRVIATVDAVAKPTFSLAAGTYAGAQNIEIACATEGATIYYTTDGTEPTAESTEYTAAIDIAATTTVKAIAIKGEDKSKIAEATYTIIEKIDGGTAAAPLTIAQAKELIDTKDAAVLAHADNKVYVKGKISQVDKFNSTYGSITYWISEDGTTTDQFEVYSGLGLNGAMFTAKEDIVVDADVVIFGNIKKYGSGETAVYEFDKENQQVSYAGPVKDVTLAATDIIDGDITAAYEAVAKGYTVRNVSITLAESVAYTVSAPIEATASVAINGAAGAKIDASALTGNGFINFATVNGAKAMKDETTESAYTILENITIKDVEITALPKSIINSAAGKVIFKNILVSNAVIKMTGNVNVFGLGGGYPENLKIEKSTIWSDGVHKNYFFKADGKPADVIKDVSTTTWTVDHSTLYNIAIDKKANNSNGGIKGKKTTTMVLTNSILYNFGTSVGNEVNGWLWGQNGGAQSTYANNTYWSADGAVAGWTDASKGGSDQTATALTTDPGFDADKVAVGDFTIGATTAQALMKTGDPRWLVEYVAPATAEVEDITLDATAGDISKQLTAKKYEIINKLNTIGNITINLAENDAYTVGATLVAPNSITINGNGATIDASALEANLIEWEAKAAGDNKWTNANVSISGVTVKGLKKALFFSNSKYYYGDFSLINSVVEQAGDATTFDYTKGSVALNFTIAGSTIYAPTATTKALYSSQGGQKATEYKDDAEQKFAFYLNTMYNLAKGKNFFSHRQNGQKWLTYGAQSNIFVNCGKTGQTIKGMNGGQGSANPTWVVNDNVFNFEGADTSAAEETGDTEEPVQNSIFGVMTFASVETPDFGGELLLPYGAEAPATAPGDPRWTITFTNAPQKLYIIGDMNNWDRTDLIEMTFNPETNAFESDFVFDKTTYFAFATKQQTAEEAAADPDWEAFNANYRYSIGDGDNVAELNKALVLVKGAENGTIELKGVKEGTTYRLTVTWDLSKVTIAGEAAESKTIDKLFIMGTGTPKGWDDTTELTFNETTQAFEYVATVTEDTYLTFGDAEFTSWDDFNSNHRLALAEGNIDATMDVELQLVHVNGCVVLKNAGAYKISVTKDLKMTITADGTGINSIAADKMKDATIYTISGQRVEKAQKGLYIINGKKVVIK